MMRDEAWEDRASEDADHFLSELYRKEFRRKMAGGYDPNEVDAFIELAGDVLKALLQELRESESALLEAKRKKDEYEQAEAALRHALVSSQKHGENVLTAAKRQAEALVEAARVEKERILLEAEQLPEALQHEIKQLRESRGRLRREMLALLSTERAFLDSLLPAEQVVRRERPEPDGETPGSESVEEKP